MTGSEITLTNNQAKDIMKVIKSLEKKGTSLKRTTGNISSQKRGFLNSFRPLMSVEKCIYTTT